VSRVRRSSLTCTMASTQLVPSVCSVIRTISEMAKVSRFILIFIGIVLNFLLRLPMYVVITRRRHLRLASFHPISGLPPRSTVIYSCCIVGGKTMRFTLSVCDHTNPFAPSSFPPPETFPAPSPSHFYRRPRLFEHIRLFETKRRVPIRHFTTTATLFPHPPLVCPGTFSAPPPSHFHHKLHRFEYLQPLGVKP
jgi:hypothetical protein